VLARGYAIVSGPDGRIVRTPVGLAEGDAIAVRLAEGGVDARVTGVRMPARGPGAD